MRIHKLHIDHNQQDEDEINFRASISLSNNRVLDRQTELNNLYDFISYQIHSLQPFLNINVQKLLSKELSNSQENKFNIRMKIHTFSSNVLYNIQPIS